MAGFSPFSKRARTLRGDVGFTPKLEPVRKDVIFLSTMVGGSSFVGILSHQIHQAALCDNQIEELKLTTYPPREDRMVGVRCGAILSQMTGSNARGTRYRVRNRRRSPPAINPEMKYSTYRRVAIRSSEAR